MLSILRALNYTPFEKFPLKKNIHLNLNISYKLTASQFVLIHTISSKQTPQNTHAGLQMSHKIIRKTENAALNTQTRRESFDIDSEVSRLRLLKYTIHIGRPVLTF